MFGEALAQLGIVAAFVQKVIALAKPAYKDWEYQKYVDLGLSLLVSAGLCFAWGVDVFAVAGVVFSLPWLGAVFTGVIAGLGSNVLNDILTLLEMWKNQKKFDVANAAIDYSYARKLDAELDAKEERGS